MDGKFTILEYSKGMEFRKLEGILGMKDQGFKYRIILKFVLIQ